MANIPMIRSGLHAGEIHYDSRAPFGEALDVAFRLLDARELKRALRDTSAPLVHVVSNDLVRGRRDRVRWRGGLGG